MGVESVCYSGTSLIGTPMGQKEVSLLVRCPHLQERYILGVGKGVLALSLCLQVCMYTLCVWEPICGISVFQ